LGYDEKFDLNLGELVNNQLILLINQKTASAATSCKTPIKCSFYAM